MERKRATSTTNDKKYASMNIFHATRAKQSHRPEQRRLPATDAVVWMNTNIIIIYSNGCAVIMRLFLSYRMPKCVRMRTTMRSFVFVVDYQQLKDLQKMWLSISCDLFPVCFSVCACAGYCRRPLTISNYYYYRHTSDINVFFTNEWPRLIIIIIDLVCVCVCGSALADHSVGIDWWDMVFCMDDRSVCWWL